MRSYRYKAMSDEGIIAIPKVRHSICNIPAESNMYVKGCRQRVKPCRWKNDKAIIPVRRLYQKSDRPDLWSIDEQLVVLLLGFRFRVGVLAEFRRKLLEQSLVHPIG